jgi:two-component system, NtrC family, sensor kinase
MLFNRSNAVQRGENYSTTGGAMNECSEQIRILCVDDERNILQALERSFLDDNYEIVNANSGAEGLQAMEESGPFQVVISDYRMPVMNGVEFLKQVYGRWPDTIRLVLSGYADVGAIVAAINEGHIYKFIPKPWDDEDLRVTIKKSLEHYLLQKRNRELREELDAANLALVEKVQQHTEQLERRNQALEYSQSLLNTLPVGVAGIDENGIITYCNDIAGKLLKNGSGEIAGTNVAACGDGSLGNLVEQVRYEKNTSVEMALAGTQYRVLGHTMAFRKSEAVILVFVEG